MGNVPQILYGEEVSLAVEEETSLGNAAGGTITGGRAGCQVYEHTNAMRVYI
jgi:hypothetical protein